jgi:hypothetical protein
LTPALPKKDPLESEESLDAFLQAFQAGTWPHAAWTHTSHVIMAGCYLLAWPEAEATERIRQGIRQYNESQGTVTICAANAGTVSIGTRAAARAPAPTR